MVLSSSGRDDHDVGIRENTNVPRTTRAQAVKYLQLLTVFQQRDGESIGWSADPSGDPHAAVVTKCVVCGSDGTMFLEPLDDRDAGRIGVSCLAQCSQSALKRACREAGIHLNKRPPKAPRVGADSSDGTAPVKFPSSPSAIPGGVSLWHQFAAWYARTKLKGRYRYNNTPGELAWWWYDGRVWHPLTKDDPRILDNIGKHRFAYAQELKDLGHERIADILANKSEWTAARADKSDMWGGLRDACSAPPPTPKLHHLGTPAGVVDLHDGRLHPHAPEFEIRGLTLGEYCPHDGGGHLEALNMRFGKVFSPCTLEAYLQLLALALTGYAQSYRALVMVIGESGSGKGDATNVAVKALGQRGLDVAQSWLAQSVRADIDPTTADIIERQPAIIKIDEMGGDTRILTSRLMTVTGNAPISGRRPYGPMIRGSIRSQFWTTAVDLPRIPRNSGIERRLAVLPTLRRLDASEIDEPGGQAPELLNAVVTLAAQLACHFYQPEYRAPEGHAEARERALAEMDFVAAWLEERGDLEGMGVREARELAMTTLGLDEKDLSANAFGRRVSSSVKWKHGKNPGGKRVIARRPSADDHLP